MFEAGDTGKLIAGRYRLEHQVGEGGMATVWVAEDEKLERWVALKLLGKNLLSSRSVRERFEREAMAIAKLRSPHVVQVFDHGTDTTGEDGEVAYIAMELLSGEDLYSWLKNNRPVPLAKIARIVGQVARGLSVAHRAGIVHRDLKPANVFVVRDHDEQTVKVFDFGLARGFAEHSQLRELRDRTGEGVLLGTPRYMSPEQAHGARKVDHRADLWSLAVIAYLAVTGRLPFDGTGVGEVVTKIATEEPTPPSEIVAGVGPEMDVFFERALAKNPDDRFQSAADLALAFDEVAVSGVPTSTEFIPLHDGDTEVELTRSDTEVSDGPSSTEDPTLGYIPSDDRPHEVRATVDSDADEPTLALPRNRSPRPENHGEDSPVAQPAGSRNTVAAALALAAALAVLAASYQYDGRAQSAADVRVPAPRTRLLSTAVTAESNATAAPEPTSSSESASKVTPAARQPPNAAPSASGASSASVTDRGLELFDDRH